MAATHRIYTHAALVKPFDVDLNWMGKFKNHEKSIFWSADDDEGRSTHSYSPIITDWYPRAFIPS